MHTDKISIIGAGSWGTALAIVLAPRFKRVRLWAHETDLVERMGASRINDIFLPGFRLPDNVEAVSDLKVALEGAGIVVGVMPSRFARAVYSSMLSHVEAGMRFVSATKGLENRTLLRMSEVAGQVLGKKRDRPSGDHRYSGVPSRQPAEQFGCLWHGAGLFGHFDDGGQSAVEVHEHPGSTR